MTGSPPQPSQEPPDLCRRLGQGEVAALAEAFTIHRERLLHAVRLRLHPRLAARLDADDVLQEAYLDAEKRLASFDPDKAVNAWVWLRLVLGQTLTDLHRRHLAAHARDAKREAPLAGVPVDSSAALSEQLVARLTSPSGAAMRAEVLEHVRAALAAMDDVDREVLVLRHFEEASNVEVAQLLGVPESTASSRYLSALARLRKALQRVQGGSDGG